MSAPRRWSHKRKMVVLISEYMQCLHLTGKMLGNISDCTKILLLQFTDQKAGNTLIYRKLSCLRQLFTSLKLSVTSLIEAKFQAGNIRMKHAD